MQKDHEFQTSLGYTASKEVSKGIRVSKRTISRGWNIAYFFLLGMSRSFGKKKKPLCQCGDSMGSLQNSDLPEPRGQFYIEGF